MIIHASTMSVEDVEGVDCHGRAEDKFKSDGEELECCNQLSH